MKLNATVLAHRGGLRLPAGTGGHPGTFLPAQAGPQEDLLDRHGPVEVGVVGVPDPAHTAVAQLGVELVAPAQGAQRFDLHGRPPRRGPRRTAVPRRRSLCAGTRAQAGALNSRKGRVGADKEQVRSQMTRWTADAASESGRGVESGPWIERSRGSARVPGELLCRARASPRVPDIMRGHRDAEALPAVVGFTGVLGPATGGGSAGAGRHPFKHPNAQFGPLVVKS